MLTASSKMATATRRDMIAMLGSALFPPYDVIRRGTELCSSIGLPCSLTLKRVPEVVACIPVWRCVIGIAMIALKEYNMASVMKPNIVFRAFHTYRVDWAT